MLQSKKASLNAVQRREIANLLEKGKEESARIRVFCAMFFFSLFFFGLFFYSKFFFVVVIVVAVVVGHLEIQLVDINEKVLNGVFVAIVVKKHKPDIYVFHRKNIQRARKRESARERARCDKAETKQK